MCKENESLPEEVRNKLNALKEYLRSLGSLAVGFSGGVDSSLLLVIAHEVLGDRALAVTAVDASFPVRELKEAKDFCKERGIRQVICTVDPLKEESYRNNSPDRCYFCKRTIFTEIRRIAAENGIDYAAEGSNMDDLGDYRPGLRAVAELAVTSPLREAGLKKAEIRQISKAMGLPTWSKPAYACLASRFVYGEEITEEKLRMIDRAEQFLIEHGFTEERVRMHGNLARIEVPPADIPRLAADGIREAVWEEFKKIGFLFVTLDLKGYRMGSMNATIKEKLDQLQRIRHYEELLQNVQQMLQAEELPVHLQEALEEKIRELEEYYVSDLWKQDFADEEAGLLPKDLPRGVLSEDGIYAVLELFNERQQDHSVENPLNI